MSFARKLLREPAQLVYKYRALITRGLDLDEENEA